MMNKARGEIREHKFEDSSGFKDEKTIVELSLTNDANAHAASAAPASTGVCGLRGLGGKMEIGDLAAHETTFPVRSF